MGKLLVVATALSAVLIMVAGAYANLETTCNAAADRDSRVNYRFCVSKLSTAPAGADAWILAQAAANAGGKLARATEAAIRARLEDPRTEPKVADPLQECYMLYHRAGDLFESAEYSISKRDYADAKRKANNVPGTVRDCNRFFVEAGLGTPFLEKSADCAMFSIICVAITDLVDH